MIRKPVNSIPLQAWALALTVIGSLMATNGAWAQGGGSGFDGGYGGGIGGSAPQAQEEAPLILKVYGLQHATADVVIQGAHDMGLFNQEIARHGLSYRVHMAADGRNPARLIVRADESKHKQIKELVEVLDQEVETPAPSAISGTPQSDFEAKARARAIERAWLDLGPEEVAVLERIQAVENAKALEAVKKDINAMAENSSLEPVEDNMPRQVRVVWMLAGDNDLEAGQQPLTNDLKPLLDEFQAIDLFNVGLVSQTLIQTYGSKRFATIGLVDGFAKTPTELVVEGAFKEDSSDSEAPSLELRISARLPVSSGAESTGGDVEYFDLTVETTLASEAGAPVVLAATPFGDNTNIFVVVWSDEGLPVVDWSEPDSKSAAPVRAVPLRLEVELPSGR